MTNMRRARALAVFAAVLTAPHASHAALASPDTSALDSILASPMVGWNKSELHPEIRSRVHLTANQVPPFPHEDTRLMNPRNWQNTSVIEGVVCSLRVHTGEGDKDWFVSSLREVKPDAWVQLFYSGAEDARGKSEDAHIGPSYSWRGDGTLRDRYWRTSGKNPFKTREYMYYPSGRLFRYTNRIAKHDRRRGSESPVELLDEVFALNGTLIGCAYRKWDGDTKSVDVSYWLAKRVEPQGYSARLAEAQTRALR